MASMVDRMIRAAKLDIELYEEVEADKGALYIPSEVYALSESLEPRLSRRRSMPLGGRARRTAASTHRSQRFAASLDREGSEMRPAIKKR